MKGGDISNVVVPRYVFVFEGLIGIPSTLRIPRMKTALGKLTGRPPEIAQYIVNEPIAQRLWHIVMHLDKQVEAVTFLGEECVEPIQEWVDRHDLPISRVRYSPDARTFSRSLAYMPAVAAVFDPDPAHRFVYGSKGHHLDPDNPTIGF